MTRAAERPELQRTTIANQSDAIIVGAGVGARYAGIQITSGAAATTVLIRHGTLVSDPIAFTYKVDAINTTRLFQMPDPVAMNSGIFCDVDANTTEAVVLYY